MPQAVKVAVVGVGHMGRLHAQKLVRMKGVKLVGVVDTDTTRARTLARQLGVEALHRWEDVVGLVKAAVVATPTTTHLEVAGGLMDRGVDVLCEKPLAASVAEARQLVEIARRTGRILQAGHLERFNPAVEEMMVRAGRVLFVECNRIAPFKARSVDVDVVLDLMIHDLDIILELVGEGVREVRAKGVAVLGRQPDLVNARVEFVSGAVANITASRLALKDERKLRIFQPECYMSLDYRKRRLLVVSGVEFHPGGRPRVKAERFKFPGADPLERELRSFVECVQSRSRPRVDGLAALKAMECAEMIRSQVTEDLARAQELLARGWVRATAEERG